MPFRRCEDVDTRALERLFEQTFTHSEGASEGRVIGQLVIKLMKEVAPGDCYGYLATDEQDTIVAAVFFSRLHFEQPLQAFLLSPMAVRPNEQGKGVGQALIRYGLDEMRGKGAELICTYGDPRFYSKVGFSAFDPEVIPPPFPLTQPEGWLCQSLTADPVRAISGHCRCVEPFNNPDYW